VEKIANPKGNPESTLQWTSLSMEHIAEAAKKAGGAGVAHECVSDPEGERLALRANRRRSKRGVIIPIGMRNLSISMKWGRSLGGGCPGPLGGCKKTEIIGNYKNKGAEWLPQGRIYE